MTPELRQHFDDLVKTHPVVLFMKGNRRFPQCGFSSSVVQVLNELVSDYKTVDVLQDAAVRDGIKLYSDWPTIPQLYIKGEFVGGADIVREMYQKGELQQLLGVSIEEVKAPTITLTDAAAKAILAAGKDAGGEPLHLAIDARFQNRLDFGPAGTGDIETMANGVKLLVDRATAKRAEGLIIDFVSEGDAQGFKLDNPNAPPQVKQITVQALKALFDAQRPIELFDVRGDDERATAKLSQSRRLDDDAMNHIARLPKDTPLYFICHHGGRSQRAATQLIEQGYRQVYNVSGGIDAWSLQIDSSIPRY